MTVIKPLDTIRIGESGEASSFTGRKAVEVFRLATLASALRLEIRCPGMKMSRHLSALAAAKQHTGLKTNDRQKQLERVLVMLDQAKTEVLYVDSNPAASG